MSDRKLRVLLVAGDAAGFRVLRMLTEGSCELAGLLQSGSEDLTGESDWPGIANVDVPKWPTAFVENRTFARTVTDLGIDILLNVNSPFIVCKEVLKALSIGAFNLHPGPLPHYSGANALNWALHNGEKEYAVTLHKMTEQVNTGAIIFEDRFPIVDTDNGFTLRSKCDQAGASLVGKFLRDLSRRATENLLPFPYTDQITSRRKRCRPNAPNGGRIDWDWLARDVVNQIRACDCSPLPSPWEPPVTSLLGDEFGICRAVLTGEAHGRVTVGTVGLKTDSGVLVACADEWIEVQKLAIDGMTVNAVDVLGPGDLLSRTPISPLSCPRDKTESVGDCVITQKNRLTTSSM